MEEGSEWGRELWRVWKAGSASYLQLLHESLLLWLHFCVADRIVWNEFIFFEITNKFLFIFQKGMQCLEMYAAPRASLAKVTFLAFLWA